MNNATTIFPTTTTINTNSTGISPDLAWSSSQASLSMPHGDIEAGSATIHGDLTVRGDIIQGDDSNGTTTSLWDRLDRIEARLAIMRPNPTLEQHFDELRELGQAYRSAEAKFNEQLKIANILSERY
jgi:hypothetical protein